MTAVKIKPKKSEFKKLEESTYNLMSSLTKGQSVEYARGKASQVHDLKNLPIFKGALRAYEDKKVTLTQRELSARVVKTRDGEATLQKEYSYLAIGI